MSELRIGTYNVMNGGGAELFTSISSMLDEQRLDLLAVQEAKHWDAEDGYRMWTLGRLLGMVPLLAPSSSHGCHVVVYYRPSRLSCLGWKPDAAEHTFHHTLARGQFEAPGGQPFTVLATHLAPFDGGKRLQEAGWFTEYAGSTQPALALGDLNTPGLGDEDPDWGTVPAHLHSRHRLANPDGTPGDSDRRAMQLLLHAGWIDAAAPAAGAGPGAPTVGHWPGSERWLHRSDFILANAAVRADRAWVIDNDLTRTASDHLPQLAEVTLAPMRSPWTASASPNHDAQGGDA
ncbi:endonuclease/exonuclease/phosphatase family metal-dependent hydrolase [Streptacidiphilus sp. BW17]|uniref:endonuclease/exonuclease/phosphatase family protein n=1 Tax=Streptacidiphilus sp. BW17 TaxID=3156274 RepID=UPI0035176B8D